MRGVFAAEPALKTRMQSIYAAQGQEARIMPRELLLRNHCIGWKDPHGVVHCDPHPDDGYLPLKDWDAIE